VLSLISIGICVDVEDSIELDILFEAVDEIVDSAEKMTEVLTNVDSLYGAVESSDKIVVLLSVLGVDANSFLKISEVVITMLTPLVDVGDTV